TALGAGVDDRSFEDTGVILGNEGTVLTMARYVPSRFERGAATAQYQRQNAGLLRSALLKRFESSAAAFSSTVETMIASHDSFLAALDGGWVLTGDALRAWASSDSDDVEAIVGAGIDFEKVNPDNAQQAGAYEIEQLRTAVVADRELLTSLRREVSDVHWRDDPKVAALADELAAIAAEAHAEGIGDSDRRNRRKVLLFTYFADTARYLHDALVELCSEDSRLADYAGRIVVVAGGARAERQDAILGFAPLTAGGTPDTDPDSDRFDLAISTDVLSEGVNLQQARNIVNYDLPWNPMRLVQRHGRVDRIGSPHDRIDLRCFFPDAELESMLGLESRLQHKLHQAAAAFGAGEVLPGMAAVDRTMAETREEIDRLRAEDATLFEDGGSAAASGEEFRRRLADAFRSDDTRRRVLGLPWGGGTGMVREKAEPGVVFCARIGDHPLPEFRYVPLTPDLETQTDSVGPVVVRDVLACLDHADPVDETKAAVMSDELRAAALNAWQVAMTDIDEQWMLRTDPRNIEPSVPAVMRRAARLVREHGQALGDRQPDVVLRLQQRFDQRVQREVRQILREHERHPVDGAIALGRAVDDLRLPRPEPVQPLPPIERDRDIHLVCWMLITAAKTEDGGS
ncbi:MAG TPA: helicase-related protein, partial [Actinomycetales bacterium]|nr:helicase-related protein [Actinomycetales bacterium]